MNSDHPDDQIFKVKDFINELSKVQDAYFSALTDHLKVSKEVEDYLFDYVYNEHDQVTFGEYLDKLGRGELWEGL